MDVTEDITSTLRATSHHPPCVLNSIAAHNHPSDSRVRISNGGCVQTLTRGMGTGGNKVPLIMNEVPKTYGICSKDSNSMKSDNPRSGFYATNTSRTLDKNGGNPSCNQGGVAIVEDIPFTQNQRDEVRLLGEKSGALNASFGTKQQTFVLQGSLIGRTENNGPKGSGVNEDVSFTLNTVDRHAVYAMTTGNYMQFENEKSPTLAARDFKDPNTVIYGIGRDAFNQGKNAKWNPCFSKEVQPTLVSKGPGAACNGYVVRRLTPTECARLQGFPDSWCADLKTENPTDEEIKKWQKIFDDYNKAVGKSTKSKTENQIRKWLKNPHSDSAEYKMWGNGVALPCVYFVLSNIVYCSQLTEK